MKDPINPQSVVLVAKANGKEVGRKAATDPGANQWLADMARAHKGLTVDYIEDLEAAKDQRLIASLFR